MSADVLLLRDDVPFPNIGTDLFDDNFANLDDDEEPLDSGPVIPDILKEDVAQTVVRMDNEDEEGEGDDSDDGDADADLENGRAAGSAAPEAPMDVPAPVSAKKGGRPSKGSSRVSTPAKTPAKTPKSAKAAGGRKRKAEESADEPAAKRSGRGRATAAAAREGIKEASKKRPRATPGTVKEVRLHLCFSAGCSVLRKILLTNILLPGSRNQNPDAVDLAENPRSRRKRSPPARSTRSRRSWTTEWMPIQSRPCSWSSGKATARRTTHGSQRRT